MRIISNAMNKISDITHIHLKLKRQGLKDMLFLCIGVLMYSFGYTAFILPDQIVMGGASGIAALLFYGFKIPPALSIWGINIIMVIIAYRTLSKQFTVRTIIGVTILSAMIGALQPVFEAYPMVTAGEDKFMHLLIGGALSGAGLGVVFAHNGSTGGTDIIIAMLSLSTHASSPRPIFCSTAWSRLSTA